MLSFVGLPCKTATAIANPVNFYQQRFSKLTTYLPMNKAGSTAKMTSPNWSNAEENFVSFSFLGSIGQQVKGPMSSTSIAASSFLYEPVFLRPGMSWSADRAAASLTGTTGETGLYCSFPTEA